jgi:hypothetical protein
MATKRVRPIGHKERNALGGGSLHGEPHGGNVGVEVHANVLDVEDKHVDIAQRRGEPECPFSCRCGRGPAGAAPH